MTGVLGRVADLIDPDSRPDRPEMATPTTLAAHLDRTYQVRAHLTLIGEELAALERGDVFDRLMINTPPRVGKTRLAVEWFVFWWLIKHPTHRVVIASYDDSLAQRAGKHIRSLITHYGVQYGLMLERGSAAAKDFSLATGGGVRSVGIGSGITGHDCDLGLIDDPTKSRAEAESQRRRDGIFDWWSSEMSTRVIPGTRLCLVQTPWHPDDLRVRVVQQEGRVEDGGRWREVIMAALAEGDDPLGRAPGEPLPHPMLTESDKERNCSVGGSASARPSPCATGGRSTSATRRRRRARWSLGSAARATLLRAGPRRLLDACARWRGGRPVGRWARHGRRHRRLPG